MLGAHPRAWHTRIPTYGRVTYRDVYPRVDLSYYGRQGTLEYDWIVRPGADPGRIQFAIAGPGRPRLDARGNLLLRDSGGVIMQARPRVYQMLGGRRHAVAGRYAVSGAGRVGFALGRYDVRRPLIIDPSLSYSTYLGGTADDYGYGIAVDTTGAAYITGSTASTAFPTANAVQSASGGSSDAFVSKFDPTGTALLYSTYLGGSSADSGRAIAVDATGAVYVTGYTYSSDFPWVTPTPQLPFGGADDVFVTKLDPTAAGSASILYSVYRGGSGADAGNGIAVDAYGDAYVAGTTASTNFPTTAGAYSASNSGSTDAFITEFTPAGTGFIYSTYLGGSAGDDGNAIALDAAGSAYVTGDTASTNFPLANAYQGSAGGSHDAVVAKIAFSPAGWTGADLGAPMIPGGQAASTTAYTITGAGADIGGTGDQFHYLWQDVAGDSSLSARLSTFTNAGSCAKAGLMYRASADPDAADYMVAVTPNCGGTDQIYVQYRDTQGVTATVQVSATGTLPQFLRAGRADNVFTAYTSSDGATWTAIAGSSVALDLAGTALLGLAVTSNNVAAPSTASFDNVAISACPDGWSCADLGAPPLPGGTGYTASTGVYTVTGSGGDIGGTGDQFHYLWQRPTGDSSLSARLTAQANSGPSAKAGLMYRGSSDAAAPFYDAVVLPNSGTPTLQVQDRTTQGGSASTVASVAVSLPLYLKVARAGSAFTAYTSSNGTTWTAVSGSGATVALSSTVLLGLAVDSASGSAMGSATFDHVQAQGTADLSALDTDTTHYLQQVGQTSGFTTEAQLYNAPVGAPDDDGWHLRDTTLAASTGVTGTTRTPYNLSIAPDTSGPSEASLSSEDGVTLSVGLASAGGTAPHTIAAQYGANAATYPGPITNNPVTFTVQATASGLDVRFTLQNSSAQGPYVVSLAPAPQLQVAQDATTGAISLTQVITDYGDDGTPDPITQTEYVVQPAFATAAGTAPATPADVGAVSMGLSAGAGGAQNLSLSIDPTWLSGHGGNYPLTIDVPLVTALAGGQTKVFGTVNSCAPSTAAAPDEVVVGVSGSCTYNGQVSFDLSAIPNTTPILTATLHLYTPGQAGPTGAQVYLNAAPAGGLAPPRVPTWSTAPALAAGAVGIAQSGNSNGWQSWNVTSLVQNWVENPGTNGGITLKATGSPVRFASVLGAGTDPPAEAPYLDIVYSAPAAQYAAAAANSGGYNDGSAFIYGVAGPVGVPSSIVPGQTTCPHLDREACDAVPGTLNIQAVHNGQRTGSPLGFGGQFIRIRQPLHCDPSDPNPVPADWQITYTLMRGAYQRAIDPVVQFDAPADCDPIIWYFELSHFVADMNFGGINPRPTYFEIGNEENQSAKANYSDYSHDFADGAAGLYQALAHLPRGTSLPWYRILTGGVTSPLTVNGCKADSYNQIRGAITTAQRNGQLSVPRAVLGVAVHPYHYQTRGPSYFKYYHSPSAVAAGAIPYGVCNDLGIMNNTWTGTPEFSGLPLIYTEINWEAGSGGNPTVEQTYLADLFTFFYAHQCNWTNGACSGTSGAGIRPSLYPIRVIWQRGMDGPETGGLDPLGLYNNTGSPDYLKRAALPTSTPPQPPLPVCQDSHAKVMTGNNPESADYFWLRNDRCYGP